MYDHLVGTHFYRNGVRYTVEKCHGATVVATFYPDKYPQRALVPVSDVLKALNANSKPA